MEKKENKKIDVITKFNKLFRENDSFGDKEIAEEKRILLIDPSQIVGIMPKKKKFQNSLLELYDVKPLPTDKNFKEFTTSPDKQKVKVPGEYLQILASIAKEYKLVSITVSNNKPLIIETKDFKVFIAPNISEGDF